MRDIVLPSGEHTLLCFDFGLRRIGVATGQTITKTAQPLTVISAKSGVPVWSEVSDLVDTWQPGAIIVGMPLNMDGTSQAMTKYARGFAAELQERYCLPVFEMDERLSSVAAKEQLFERGGFKAVQRGKVDSVAAQYILQHWLDNYFN